MKYAILNGQKVYRVQETASDLAVSCPDDVEVGWLYRDGQFVPPPGSLFYAKTRKRQEINNLRGVKLKEPIIFNGIPFDSDTGSINTISSYLAGYNNGVPFPNSFIWRSADNTNVPMTLVELNSLLAALIEHLNSIYVQSWEKKQEIEQSTTIKAVESISW